MNKISGAIGFEAGGEYYCLSGTIDFRGERDEVYDLKLTLREDEGTPVDREEIANRYPTEYAYAMDMLTEELYTFGLELHRIISNTGIGITKISW
jgi:hypothetical protein